MERLATIRLAVAAAGIVTWAVGYARDDDRIRLIGIIVMAVALIMRFGKRWIRDDGARR